MKQYEAKPLFLERMKKLLVKDFESYIKILKKEPSRSIRANKLKISPAELGKKLELKGWTISQPFKTHEEIMIVENELEPGELGRSFEHILGYYYIQEIASMLPVLVLEPNPNQLVLDLCAAPGSKTTQIAAEMKNTGTIIANEISLRRIKILASNLERCGVMNTIITKKEGLALCRRLKDISKGGVDKGKHRFPLLFDKILVDAPCSGEGTLRSSPKTYKMWNINTVRKLSRIQKNLLASALEILKPGGEIIYSTCTHAPEENEGVIDFVLENFDDIKVEPIELPIKCRKGISRWAGQKYNKEVTKACRIYPQDNDTEGFFIAKLKKIK